MEKYILIGVEDIRAAAQSMRAASNEISRAANSIEDSLSRHRMFLDDWLMRLEKTLREQGGI